jgi:hypothetical protein
MNPIAHKAILLRMAVLLKQKLINIYRILYAEILDDERKIPRPIICCYFA